MTCSRPGRPTKPISPPTRVRPFASVFAFFSDGSTVFAGAYVDDVTVVPSVDLVPVMISSPGALGEIFTGDAVSVALTANVDDVAWSIADSDNANWLDVDANTGILSEGVSGLRERLGISRVDPAAAGPAMISINEAARRLSIASSSVRILIREGALSGTQAMPSAPWRIPAVELFSADCPQPLRELVTEARSEGFVATGIKWMDSDGDLHAVGAADHLRRRHLPHRSCTKRRTGLRSRARRRHRSRSRSRSRRNTGPCRSTRPERRSASRR